MARAAKLDVATFQSNVVMGLKSPSPSPDPVIMARVTFSGAIHVIQLKVLRAVNR
jgi:hypothetical protein